MSRAKLTPTKLAQRKLASQYAQGIQGIIYATDSNGNTWTTDTYSAIKYRIEPNTPRATVSSTHPVMPRTLSSQGEYVPCTCVTTGDDGFTTLSHDSRTAKVNTRYYQNLCKALPRATVCLGAHLTPVVFRQDGEIVGLLAPVRS